MTGLALSMLFSAGITAQTSYYLNSTPISGTGVDNVAIGPDVLSALTNGSYNIGIGRWSLVNTSTGYRNIAVGGSVLGYNTTGYSNAALGYGAMAYNISGSLNSAFGNEALYSLTTGYSNSAFGNGALHDNTTGQTNSAFGHLALTNNNGSNNSAFGNSALFYNTTGHHNAAIGTGVITLNTTGSFNAAIGYYAGYNNVTGDSNTFVGSFSNISASNLHNATAIGNKALVNASNRLWLGSSITSIWGSSVYNVSDKRFKSAVSSEDVKGLAFIQLLRPVVYNFDDRKLTEFMAKNLPDSMRKIYLDQNFGATATVRKSGFLAQEVEEAANKAGYNFSGIHKPENDNDTYGIAYAEFVVPLVKAVQEQQKMIEDQSKENSDLQSQVVILQNQMKELLGKTGVTTGLNQANTLGSEGFAMEQNIPNPFNGETTVKYTLPQTVGSAKMIVYDLSGKQVASFPVTEKGSSSLTITSEKLTAGIYIYSIIADGKIVDSKRMVVAEK